jgi:hypothetical protein
VAFDEPISLHTVPLRKKPTSKLGMVLAGRLESATYSSIPSGIRRVESAALIRAGLSYI